MTASATRGRTGPGDLLALNCAVLLFGTAGPLGKAVSVSPVSIVFYRAVIAAGALWLWVIATRLRGGSARQAPDTARPLGDFVKRRVDVVGLFGSGLLLAVHWTAFFESVQTSGVAIGLLSFATFPVFMTVLEPVFLRVPFRGIDLVRAVVVAGGLALVVPEYDLKASVVQGTLLGVFSALTFAILAFLNRRFTNRCSPALIAASQNTVAAVGLCPIVLASTQAVARSDVVMLGVLGVLSTATAHALYIRGLRSVRPSVVGVLTALEPVYGILLAALFMGEFPKGRCLLGGTIILAAAISAASSQRSLDHG
ncbi:MAG: DMT family transporter [Verrucomicrobiae bacterium]|nr:DMT family transporter [Verrucomicrobiae bacterium]